MLNEQLINSIIQSSIFMTSCLKLCRVLVRGTVAAAETPGLGIGNRRQTSVNKHTSQDWLGLNQNARRFAFDGIRSRTTEAQVRARNEFKVIQHNS